MKRRIADFRVILALMSAACASDRVVAPPAPTTAEFSAARVAATRIALVAQAQATQAALQRAVIPSAATPEQAAALTAEQERLRADLAEFNAAIDSLDRQTLPARFFPRAPSAGHASFVVVDGSVSVGDWGPGNKTVVRVVNFGSSSVEFDTQVTKPAVTLDAYLLGTSTGAAPASFEDDASDWTPLNLPVFTSMPANHPLDFDCQSGAATISANTRHQAGWGSVSINDVDVDLQISTNTHDVQSCAPYKVTVSVSPSTVTVGYGAAASGSITNSNGGAVNSTCMWQWSSSNSGVASVDPFSGAISTSSAGTATITGTCGLSISGSASISVVLADDTCDDEAADNYGDVGQCTYPPTVCEDPEADNYLDDGDCTYTTPPPTTCEDPAADNYGASGDCTYSDPAPSDPVSGSPDDPCDYEIFYDPYCDDYQYAMMLTGGQARGARALAVRLPLATAALAGGQRPGARALEAKLTLATADATAYYVVLVDGWADASVMSMVGRFPHAHGYVDAIYLPATNPTIQGFTLAVRALALDRASRNTGQPRRRVIRVARDGSQRFTRADGRNVQLQPLALVPASALSKLNADFNAGLLKKIHRAPKHASKYMAAVQEIKWPRR